MQRVTVRTMEAGATGRLWGFGIATLLVESAAVAGTCQFSDEVEQTKIEDWANGEFGDLVHALTEKQWTRCLSLRRHRPADEARESGRDLLDPSDVNTAPDRAGGPAMRPQAEGSDPMMPARAVAGVAGGRLVAMVGGRVAISPSAYPAHGCGCTRRRRKASARTRSRIWCGLIQRRSSCGTAGVGASLCWVQSPGETIAVELRSGIERIGCTRVRPTARMLEGADLVRQRA